ncbi:MAG: MFS transporter [Mycobacteriales bacterium]
MSQPASADQPAGSPARARAVFAYGEYRAVWLAQVLSLFGDRLARIALTVLVYDRTGSPLLTALVYAATFLPFLVGLPLSGLADRVPRRQVMVACDVIRAGLVTLMVIPGLPVPVLIVLIFGVGLGTQPFSAARAGLMRDIFEDRTLYRRAQGVANASFETTQIVGFAVGGAAVALLGTRGALIVDVVTFVASALLLTACVKTRRQTSDETRDWRSDLRAGVRLVFGDPWLRSLVGLAWLATFYIAPEAIAVPYARSQGGGPLAVGMLLAANPIGSVIGNVLVTSRRVGEQTAQRWMVPMAVACGLPLIACAFQPGLVVCWVLWLISGVFTGYNVPAQAAFTFALPVDRVAQAMGLVQAGLQVGQGVGLLLAGAAADWLSPLAVVALFGGVGIAAAVGIATQIRGASASSL